MKKILFMMSLCALAFASCQKAEIEEVAASAGQNTYTFVVNNVSETKATIGDKNGTQWPVLWAAGDQIGVYGGGQLLGVATLDEGSAGSNRGNFTLTTDATLSAGDELYFSYPYVEGAEMKKGQVAEKHTVTAAGIGANGVAYAYAEYAGANTEFTLTHLNAYLKFNLSSSEFAGYSLEGITLWAKGAKLSGGVEVGNGDAVTYTGAGDYVKTTLATPAEMSTTVQPVYVSTLPDDLTGKDVYAIVHMTKGIETVTLPVKLNGAGNIPAGSVTEVTLPALKKSLAPKWYEPVETRYIAAYGEGWCYGPENTALFTESNVAQTLEFKARGNFMKVVEPKSIKIHQSADLAVKTTGIVYIGGVDSYSDGAHQTFDLDANKSASIAIKRYYNNPSASLTDIGHISMLTVLDESGNVIWGTNLWLALKPFVLTDYNNGKVLDRNIGADYSPVDKNHWATNGCYFQWGRPWAYAWSADLTNTNKEKVTETQTFEYTMTKPFTFFYYSGEPYNWFWGDGNSKDRSGDLDDLWGNPNGENTAGVKSIYDPCPQGYRVVSPAILAEVEDGLVSKVVTTTSPNYVLHKNVAWGFAGAYGGSLSGSNLAKLGSNNTTYMCAYWSNSNNAANGRMMSYQPSAEEDKRLSTGRARAAALPIRCMVDTENR